MKARPVRDEGWCAARGRDRWGAPARPSFFSAVAPGRIWTTAATTRSSSRGSFDRAAVLPFPPWPGRRVATTFRGSPAPSPRCRSTTTSPAGRRPASPWRRFRRPIRRTRSAPCSSTPAVREGRAWSRHQRVRGLPGGAPRGALRRRRLRPARGRLVRAAAVLRQQRGGGRLPRGVARVPLPARADAPLLSDHQRADRPLPGRARTHHRAHEHGRRRARSGSAAAGGGRSASHLPGVLVRHATSATPTRTCSPTRCGPWSSTACWTRSSGPAGGRSNPTASRPRTSSPSSCACATKRATPARWPHRRVGGALPGAGGGAARAAAGHRRDLQLRLRLPGRRHHRRDVRAGVLGRARGIRGAVRLPRRRRPRRSDRPRQVASIRQAIRERLRRPSPRETPYENGLDSFYGVLCADADIPRTLGEFRSIGAYAEAGSFFGPLWWWNNAPCATWPKAPDRYAGPGRPVPRRRCWSWATTSTASPATTAPSPAASCSGTAACSATPGWGHTAFGRSACTTDYMTAYLLDGSLPPPALSVPPTPIHSFPRPRPSHVRPSARRPRNRWWASRRSGPDADRRSPGMGT